MRPTNCITCGAKILQPKTSKKLYCDDCKRKRRIQQTLVSQKKKNPNKEIGVGSGNSYRNKHQPLGIQTYRKAKKDCCEKCGSIKNLLVHHLDENRHNNDVSNLITLCKSCHQALHTIRDEVTGKYKAKQNP